MVEKPQSRSEQVARWRAELGMTVIQFAAMCEVPTQYIYSWESGKHQPSARLFEGIAIIVAAKKSARGRRRKQETST